MLGWCFAPYAACRGPLVQVAWMGCAYTALYGFAAVHCIPSCLWAFLYTLRFSSYHIIPFVCMGLSTYEGLSHTRMRRLWGSGCRLIRRPSPGPPRPLPTRPPVRGTADPDAFARVTGAPVWGRSDQRRTGSRAVGGGGERLRAHTNTVAKG